MNTTEDILAECRSRGLHLALRDDGIVFEPVAAMTAELARRVRRHRAEVMSRLASTGEVDPPEHGCWNCGCMEFARDIADHGWVCVRCHPRGELRAHVARCTARYPSRRGGAP